MNQTIKVFIVTHKDYIMPFDDMYQPISVGPNKDELQKQYLRDDLGDNIAEKNNQYSELTALYWIWKNADYDYLGIVHYRRYMSKKRTNNLKEILSQREALDILQKYDMLAIKPRIYLETIKKHYINCHKSQRNNCIKQISILGNVIKEYSPEYYSVFDSVMNGHSAHMFNIFIMRKTDLDAYCKWMFPILFETEKRIGDKGVTYERIMGSLSEFLLDVWSKKNNKNVRNMELYQTEMNFFKRVQRFLYRRFFEKDSFKLIIY